LNKTIYNLWKKVGINYFWGDLYDSRFYIAQLISKKNIECILDIGCGAGVLLHFAKAQLKIGIDLSLESLIAAKKIHEEKMELIQSDVRFLPFKDDFFTNILAMHIISAFDKSKSDRIKCMSEIQRIASNTCERPIDVVDILKISILMNTMKRIYIIRKLWISLKNPLRYMQLAMDHFLEKSCIP